MTLREFENGYWYLDDLKDFANGGELIQQFDKSAEDGGAESLRFRIDLAKHPEE